MNSKKQAELVLSAVLDDAQQLAVQAKNNDQKSVDINLDNGSDDKSGNYATSR